MKELKDYSYDELRAEYFKRRREKFGEEDIRWNYWNAKIVDTIEEEGKYHYERIKYIVEPLDKDIEDVGKTRFKVNQKAEFKKNEMPRTGDVVLMRYRKHSNGIDFIDESKIIKIVERNSDE